MVAKGYLRTGCNLVVLLLWGWLFSDTLVWCFQTFTHAHYRTNLVLLVLIIGAVVWRTARRRSLRIQQHWNLPAAVLLLVALASFLFFERGTAVHTLSAVSFGLASYALLGFYLEESAWRRSLPAVLALIAALPFGDHAEGYLGFPARLLSADIVSSVLHSFGVASPSTQTVILLENGVAHIDTPCSGVRSLWNGLIFLLGITWIERRPMNLSWLAGGLGLFLLLLMVNVARIFVIVVVASVFQLRQVAEMIHEPLGVAGFICACAAVFFFLHHTRPKAYERAPENGETESAACTRKALVPAALMLLLAGAILLHAPGEQRIIEPPAVDLSGLQPEPAPLTPGEQALEERFAGTRTEKHRFVWRDLSGTLITTYSKTWRPHHPPEVCLVSNGFRIEEAKSVSLGPQEQLRRTAVEGNRTMFYWFQSRSRTTDSVYQRIWADLTGKERAWVMVMIFVERELDGDPLRDLYREVRGRVASVLER